MEINKEDTIYFNDEADLEDRIEDLLSRLTIDEKISLLTGYTGFSTQPIERLGIPEFGMTDGPHGVAPHSAFGTNNIYFPSAVSLAASWDPDLANEYGKALAEEVRAVGRHCILAPGINIHRTPLCGRNFEYFTEDPYLNKVMVVPLIRGIQSKRIAACVKHYICNNSEVRRRYSNSIVNERALEEIYFPGFKAAVSEADVWMIMGSYNKVNGKYVYRNKSLLKDTLMEKWGFSGFIVSDWFATHSVTDPAESIKAGFMLEMPKKYVYIDENVKTAYENKEFSEEELDENIKGFLRVLFNVGLFDSEEKIPKGERNTESHLETARKMIEGGAILLKNDNHVLPLNLEKIKKICIQGKMADYTPFIKQIGGSSAVKPPEYVTTLDAFQRDLEGKVEFVKNPKEADVVIHITGITHWFGYDSEGMDKKDMKMKKKRVKKILKASKKNPNTIVVLYNGGPLEMDQWIDKVAAALEVWQPHQEAGNAILNLLLGRANPSGKLPTTFPKKLSDSPAHQSARTYPAFKYSYWDMIKHEALYIRKPNNDKAKPIDIYYDEGIYVGYRYFDKKAIEPLFPFGFGLSYTEFEYSDLKIEKKQVSSGSSPKISIKLKNKGLHDGAEVVQVYAKDLECSIDRPEKELIAFKKVLLNAGEEKTIDLTLDSKELSFYDEKKHQWILESGEFKILVGSSSRDIRLEDTIQLL